MKITPDLLRALLEGRRDRNGIEDRVDRDPAVAGCRLALRLILSCRPLHAQQGLPLAQRNAELVVGFEDLGVDLVERFRAVLLLRRRIVVEVLVVDRAVVHARPQGLAHGEPAPIGVEPPREHPLGLIFLAENEADDIFRQALGALSDSMSVTNPYLYWSTSRRRTRSTVSCTAGILPSACGFKDRGWISRLWSWSLWRASTLAGASGGDASCLLK
jgi:hypothetical protein